MQRFSILAAGAIAILVGPATTLFMGMNPASAQPIPVGQTSPDTHSTGWYGSLTPRAVFDYTVDLESDDSTVEVDAGIDGVDPTTVEVDSTEIAIDTDTGFGLNGAIGYQFQDARAELELGYSNNTVNGVSIGDAAEIDADGSFDTWTLAANGYYDIPTGTALRPYIGAGLGVAKLVADDVSVDLPVVGDAELDDSGVSLIFQAQAGLAYDFTENASAFVGYRLQGIPNQSFSAADIDLQTDTTLIHSAQLGAQYRF
ncbi:MAG: outer membrane beta-barrel protein [Cyanobacteria bacterium P01_F01_bin.150]